MKTKTKRTRRSVPRDSPPQRSSIYRGVTRFSIICSASLLLILLGGYCSSLRDFDFFGCGVFECLGIVGRVDMRLICGIRIAGMNRRTRKEDKVISSNECLNYNFRENLINISMIFQMPCVIQLLT